jgi:hypothetical protein
MVMPPGHCRCVLVGKTCTAIRKFGGARHKRIGFSFLKTRSRSTDRTADNRGPSGSTKTSQWSRRKPGGNTVDIDYGTTWSKSRPKQRTADGICGTCPVLIAVRREPRPRTVNDLPMQTVSDHCAEKTKFALAIARCSESDGSTCVPAWRTRVLGIR